MNKHAGSGECSAAMVLMRDWGFFGAARVQAGLLSAVGKALREKGSELTTVGTQPPAALRIVLSIVGTPRSLLPNNPRVLTHRFRFHFHSL